LSYSANKEQYSSVYVVGEFVDIMMWIIPTTAVVAAAATYNENSFFMSFSVVKQFS
jgi:hypothetical protein